MTNSTVFTQEVITTPFTTWVFDESHVVRVEGKRFQNFALIPEVVDALKERGISASVDKTNVLEYGTNDLGHLTTKTVGQEFRIGLGKIGIEYVHDEPVYAYAGEKILFLNYGEFSVINPRVG